MYIYMGYTRRMVELHITDLFVHDPPPFQSSGCLPYVIARSALLRVRLHIGLVALSPQLRTDDSAQTSRTS